SRCGFNTGPENQKSTAHPVLRKRAVCRQASFRNSQPEKILRIAFRSFPNEVLSRLAGMEFPRFSIVYASAIPLLHAHLPETIRKCDLIEYLPVESGIPKCI
ncbi:MAG TPA: hypothetical protein PK008_11280, partial [Aminivibrio sp.]|uniref:hypothetical protein n=1 Tax=Aminivibrio sp. TaxID=1872489 RepID=UPI002C86236E